MTEQQKVWQLISEAEHRLPWYRATQERAAKRALDILVSGILVIITLPVMLVVALVVKLTSPGPVLFSQTRLKMGAEPFKMFKFRTMTAGKAHVLQEVTATDSRLTPVGAFLRASRLDELPQLVHVLLGHMSLVGPRPDVPQNLTRYKEEQFLRFAMPQGCTTWGVVRGGLTKDWSTRQDINVEYVEQWNFLLDLKIILMSAWVLIRQEGMEPESAEN